jgi:hypothetical protein
MSKSDACENSLLLLLFNNTNFANVGDATGVRGSTAAGSFYVSLHTADPAEGGNQASSEVAYGGYARVAVARTAGGFTVTGNSVSPAATITFPVGSSGSGTATHFGIGTASAGAGVLLYSGTIAPNLPVGTGLTPSLSTGTAITED